MVPRRRIGELLSQYDLEPGLPDIFVEGHLDEVVVRRFLRQSSIGSTGVFRIESIDVPNALLSDNERGSQRGRLAALSRHLDKVTDGRAPVRCIVDRDFDSLQGVGNLGASPLLLRTDWSTIEMYFFDRELVESVLTDYYRVTSLDASMLMQSVSEVLKSASLMFAANQGMELGCSHLALAKCCEYSNDRGLIFDHQDYMNRYLNTGAAMAVRAEFQSEVERLRSLAPTNVRLWARGHDFLELLAIALRKHGVKSRLCVPEAIEGAFTVSVDHGYLRQFNLFKQLLQWRSEVSGTCT